MEEVAFDIPVELSSPLDARIAKVFSVYDHSAAKMVDARDIGVILRSLGCVPMEAEVQDIIAKTELSKRPGHVHLSHLLPHLKSLLSEGKMKPSPPEDLLDAFKMFDPKGKGFIEKKIFVTLLTEVGEKMTSEEVEAMIKSVVDPTDKLIHYETYINQLIHEPEDSIYKLAKDYAKAK